MSTEKGVSGLAHIENIEGNKIYNILMFDDDGECVILQSNSVIDHHDMYISSHWESKDSDNNKPYDFYDLVEATLIKDIIQNDLIGYGVSYTVEVAERFLIH